MAAAVIDQTRDLRERWATHLPVDDVLYTQSNPIQVSAVDSLVDRKNTAVFEEETSVFHRLLLVCLIHTLRVGLVR